MSTDRTPEGSLPNKIIIADASNETIDVPGFVTPFAVVSGRDDDDGTPRVRQADHAFMDPPQVRVHDLQRKTPAGIPDRRVSFQVVNDFGAEYADAGPDESPYGQVDPFTAQNRTTRVADGDGAVALFSSLERNVGSEDGRFARALTCLEFDGGPKSPKDKAPPDPPLPEGVTISDDTVTVGGTAGNVSIKNPAAVEAAKEANRQGGTAQEIFAWALAAEQGRDPPPIKGERSLTRAKEEDAPPPAPQVPAEKPGGYVTGDGSKVGQLGTFFAPGSGEPIHEGSRGEAIGTLPGRWDAQWALDQERRGPLWIKDEDAAKVQELKGGILVKGYLAPDTSLKDHVGHLPGNTHALAVLIRIPAPIPGDGPPEPPPQPPPPPPPPPFINLLPNGGSFTPIPDGTVVIPSPTGDGSKWIGTHGPNNELLWRKVLANGTVVGGYQVDPDGTQTQIDGNGSNSTGFIASPNGYAPPVVSAESAAALAAAKDRTVIYVDEDTGVLSSVDPNGTASDLTAAGTGGGSAGALPGGTGADGDYDPADAASLAAGLPNYDNFTLQAGRTIKGNAGQFHYVQVAGDATLNGTINLDGRGNAGGNGGAGGASSAAGNGTNGTAGSAGTGTKAATAGGGARGGGSGSGDGATRSGGNGGTGGTGGNRGAPWSADGQGTGGAGTAGGTGAGSAGTLGGNATAVNQTLLARRVSHDFLVALLGGAGGGGGGGGGGYAAGTVVAAGGAGASTYADADGTGADGAAGTFSVDSSGGGGGGKGGRGGGVYVMVVRGNVSGTFTINARGAQGGNGGVGNATGGDGGAGGGGGGGFVLIVFYGTWSATMTCNVAGGDSPAGQGAGEDGFYAVVNGSTGEVVQWGGSLASIAERTSALVAVQPTVSAAPADPLVATAPTTLVPVDTSGGAFAVELPPADSVEVGDSVVLKDAGGAATANPLTVDANAADTIDGGSSTSLGVDSGAITVQKITANTWMVV